MMKTLPVSGDFYAYEYKLIKAIKFLINVAGLIFISIPIALFGLIVRQPACEGIMEDIVIIIQDLLIYYILGYLFIIVGINFLFERILEKRLDSQGYINLFLLHWTFIVLLTAFSAFRHYQWVCHP